MFDKTQPADNTKIRNLGVVIRPNWDAIETGDATFLPYAINFQDRTPLIVPNDPATIAGSAIYYTKQDGTGTAESFNKDPAGNIIQLTTGGRLGNAATNATINNLRFGASVVDYGINNIVSAMCQWNTGGAQISAFGCTVVNSGVGIYTVTLTTPRNNLNYWVTATANNEGSTRTCKVAIINVTSFAVYITGNNAGNLINCGGFCHVVGGF